ncbi:MAG: hypothetical protein VR68_11860 [Peptococcaceae bacterium BRH_c4a]|nr:MAG: hypothetical protein VR68_11860 [Peptococcaceae bacterium BRH_c4a]
MSKREDSFRPPIKLIRLKNIQSLPFAEIEPAPSGKLTVIVGGSDTGKTTLASRALRKLFFNDVPTKEIVRRKCKSASIAVIYDTPDNLTVSWCWKGRNTDAGKAWWEIARGGIGEGCKLETVVIEGGGRQGHVPEAIQEITGVRPVVIGGTTLNFNFNRQLDGPFLGDKSPNERYRVLGILAGTLEVDAALKEVGTEIIRGRKQETVLDKEITALDEEVKGYDWLEVLGGDIEKVEAALVEIGRKQELRGKLLAALENIQEEQRQLFEANNRRFFLNKAILQVDAWLGRTERNMGIVQRLASALDNINTQKVTLGSANIILRATDSVVRGQESLSRLEVSHSLFKRLNALCDQIYVSFAELRDSEKVITDTKSAPEMSTIITTMAERNATLSTLRRLQKDIQGEAAKITHADTILRATEGHKKAAESLEHLSESNRTRSSLLSSQVGIANIQRDIFRHNKTIALTADTDKGKEVLAGVELAIPKVKKLRELEKEISSQKDELALSGNVLAATEGVGWGNRVLTQIEAKALTLNRLTPFPGQIKVAAFNVDSYSGQVNNLTAKIDTTTQEYRELLLEAGICEGCKVVGEVLAAVE